MVRTRHFNPSLHVYWLHREERNHKLRAGLIISPKFEISGILWFWSGRRLRRRSRRTPRLVFHVTATPMRVSNSYLTQPLMN